MIATLNLEIAMIAKPSNCYDSNVEPSNCYDSNVEPSNCYDSNVEPSNWLLRSDKKSSQGYERNYKNAKILKNITRLRTIKK
ncbi:hypothetical protein CEXT_141641 [Caerostris extrusa]|uniref:Uncharacterized protein n=1 Tax=Caerostris extrusa TaxID=172846 RepID=A0AAV4US26_CAEEX|nr:hypothetical protein CEXT_141641 [Caerostris extrusa]